MATELIAAAVGAAAGVLTALITALAQRRRVSADAADRISAAWEKLVAPYESRLSQLEQDLKELRAENDGLRDRIRQLEEENQRQAAVNVSLARRYKIISCGVRVLIEQIEECGLVPSWRPDPDLLRDLDSDGDGDH